MPGPVLLIHDDISVIAPVKRVLQKNGIDSLLVTNAADAVITFGDLAPDVVVLAPDVDGSRGEAIYEEIRQHPRGASTRFVLLGRTMGVAPDAPVLELPLDGQRLLDAVNEAFVEEQSLDGWKLREASSQEAPAAEVEPTEPASDDDEPDPWRVPAPPDEPPAEDLADSLFGDLAGDEPQAIDGGSLALDGSVAGADAVEVLAEAASVVDPEELAKELVDEEQARALEEAEEERRVAAEREAEAAALEEEALEEAKRLAEANRARELGEARRMAEENLRQELEADARALADETALALADEEEQRIAEERTRVEAEARARELAERTAAAFAEDEQRRVTAEAKEREAEALRRAEEAERKRLEESRRREEAERERIARLEQEAREQEAKAAELRLQEEREQQRLAALHEQEQREREKLEALRRRAEEQERKAEELRRQEELELARLESLENTEEEERQRLEALRQRAEEQERKAEALREQEELEQRRLDELVAEERAEQERLDRLAEQAAEQEKRAEALRRREIEEQRRLVELEGRAREEQARVEALQARAAEAEARAEELRRSEEAEKERLQALQQREEQERQRLEALKRQAEEQEQRAEALRRHEEEEQRRLELLKEREEEERERLEALKRKAEEQRERAETLKRHEEEELARLAALKAAADEEERRLLEERRRLEEELAAIEARKAEAQRKADEERQRIAQLAAEVEEEERRAAEEQAAAEQREREARAATPIHVVESEPQAPESERRDRLRALPPPEEPTPEELQQSREEQLVREQQARREEQEEIRRREESAQRRSGPRKVRPFAAGRWRGATRNTELPPQELEAEAVASESDADVIDAGFRNVPPPRPTLAPFAPRGTLAQLDAPSLVCQAWEARLTGRIDVAGIDVPRTLWFEEGRLVAAASASLLERLEDVALRAGLITAAQHHALRVSDERYARRLAIQMVELGYIRPAELYPLVRRHVEEIAWSLFLDEESTYVYSAESATSEERVVLPLHPYALATEGIRRKFSVERLYRHLGGPATLLRPRQGGPDLNDFGFSAREKRLASMVDGLRTLEELLFEGGMDEPAALKVFYALHAAGAVEIAILGQAARLRSPAEAARLDLVRVSEKYAHVVGGDYFQILGLRRDATAYEVREAWERLSRDFNPDRFLAIDDPQVLAQLEEIGRALGEAYDVLSDDAVREEYARHLLD